VTATHGILFLWLVELNNRLGWVESFQVTSTQNMQAISCKSYNTYKKCFDDLINWGFVQLIKQSKNQYQCNVIALSNFTKASDKAKAKAIDNSVINQLMNQSEITDDIHKTRNNKSKIKNVINHKTAVPIPKDEEEVFEFMKQYAIDKSIDFNHDDMNDLACNFFNYFESIGWFWDDEPIRNWKSFAKNWVKREGNQYESHESEMNEIRNL
jgi:hypothetical protein